MSYEQSKPDNTGEEQDTSLFKPGQSGNPNGRPKGALNKASRAIRALMEGEAEELGRVAIHKALEGDKTALRLCLDRIVPARKDAPIQFELPVMSNASEAAVAAQAVLKAVSEGEVTPLEGATVMGLLEQYRRTLEASEFENRIEALEAKK
jgi:hypothetical protein